MNRAQGKTTVRVVAKMVGLANHQEFIQLSWDSHVGDKAKSDISIIMTERLSVKESKNASLNWLRPRALYQPAQAGSRSGAGSGCAMVVASGCGRNIHCAWEHFRAIGMQIRHV